eukprot:gene63309-biopygen46200
MQGPNPNPQNTDNAGFYQLLSTPAPPQFATVVLRPRDARAVDALAPALRRELAKVDPNLPLYFVGPAKLWHDGALGQFRLGASLFGIVGLVAVLLSAVGLYGVMSFAVNQRTQEIGIRMALGADARRILRLILRQGAAQLTLGLALGILAALALAILCHAFFTTYIPNVNALDPVIYFSVAALLTVVATISCLVPARRATRVDPMVALRTE